MKTTNPINRIKNKYLVDQKTGCWTWIASNREGYPLIWHNKKMERAHRVVYQILIGSIQSGLYLDHLCRNKLCINPDHLEPVTPRINTLRGLLPEKSRARHANQTHCKHGHEYKNDTVYHLRQFKNGVWYRQRVCKKCRKRQTNERRLKIRQCKLAIIRSALILQMVERLHFHQYLPIVWDTLALAGMMSTQGQLDKPDIPA